MTRTYYEEEGYPRCNVSNRGSGYALSRDRGLPPTPTESARSFQLQPHDSRNSDHGSEQESNTTQRRRIPVACGRCRKRKIRCSGDPGNGNPCSNCKSAGTETCAFLRVSSTEAPMKNDSGEFGYDTVASRQASCRMIPQVGYPYTPQLTPISPDGLTSYRTNSVSYSYPMKNCYQVPYDYSDENLNYGLQSQGYPMISPDHLGIHSSYEGPSTTRGWTPASQISKDAPLFLEQGSVYNQGPIPYHTGGYGLRHAISPDSKSYNLNNIPSLSGPTPISGNDRLLPIPATNRTAQIGSFHRSGDSVLPSSHQGISSYNGLMGVPNMLTVKSSNSNSLAENNSLSTSYVPLSSNSPESIPSSQPNYGSQSVPVSQEHEIYPSSSSSLYHHDNISSEEPTYGYIHNPAPKRHSEASAASDGSLPSSTNNNLANGYPYTPLPGPPHGSHYSTTASPMDMRPLHRSSVGSIQAA